MDENSWIMKQREKNLRCSRFFDEMETIYSGKKRNRLFHYTTFESFRSILHDGKIYLTPYKMAKSRVKEIMESKTTIGTSIEILLGFYEMMASYSYACFIYDLDESLINALSVMSFGKLSSGGKCVCIELDADKLITPGECLKGRMCYNDSYPIYPLKDTSIDTLAGIASFFRNNSERFLFYKRSCWEAENEYRIWGRNGQGIDVANAITSVYLSTADKNLLSSVQSLCEGIPVMQINTGESPVNLEPISGFESYFKSVNMFLDIGNAVENYAFYHYDLNHIF